MASFVVNDWQLHKSVLDSNKYMLDIQLYCDVTFVFAEESEKVTFWCFLVHVILQPTPAHPQI